MTRRLRSRISSSTRSHRRLRDEADRMLARAEVEAVRLEHIVSRERVRHGVAS